jgi:D-glycero-alpha-D-manno-heptose-7-phosphate kinase
VAAQRYANATCIRFPEGNDMIVTRTPYRISLFGGGTDYPKWYHQHGGAVLGLAIDKYCYINLRRLPPFFEHRHRIVYSRIETVREITEIEHPAVRAVLQESGVIDGLEIHHDGDLPARSGIGSSSSFTVGLVHALRAYSGRISSKRELAEEATRIEQEVIGENVGAQDQIWAAYGGFNRIDFDHDGSYRISPVFISRARQQELLDHLMLVFTGQSRVASAVAQETIANMDRQVSALQSIRSMVDQAEALICDPKADIRTIGALLHEAWTLKRGLAASVSNELIDSIYREARRAGAIGGKVLGAGGGGFLLFFVEPDRRQAVRERLGSLIEVDIGVDRGGSSVVLYQPDGFARS